MTRRAIRMIGLLVAMLVTLPRASDAGILEVIWEMSGPRMLGVGAYCRFSVHGDVASCAPGKSEGPLIEQRKRYLPWFAVEGTFYFSVPHNGFDWGDAYMLAVEPEVEWAWPLRTDKFLVFSGVGYTYNGLFGPQFFAFDNSGVKIKPIAFQRKGWGVEYNIRTYADEFSRDLFNRAPPFVGNRPRETIHAVALILPI